MKTFIINLERSSDRKLQMQQQFTKIGMPVSSFSAINGSNLPLEYRKRIRPVSYNILMGNPGFNVDNEIACFASHYCLWQLCVKDNETLLILEDDIGISTQFKTKLSLVEALVNNLGYLRLMALEHKHGAVSITSDLLCYKHFPCGTQGYAVSPEGARKLIANALYWTEPVDMYLDKYWIHGLCPYCINPELITHREEIKSSISEGGIRANHYLPKPTGGIKLLREIVIRPWQRYKKKSFESRNPIVSKEQVEEWLKS